MEFLVLLFCVSLVVGIGAVIRNTEAPSELINLDRPSSTLADCGHVKGANVSDANKVSESSSERTDSDFAENSRSREIWFSVGMLLLIAYGFLVAVIGGDKFFMESVGVLILVFTPVVIMNWIVGVVIHLMWPLTNTHGRDGRAINTGTPSEQTGLGKEDSKLADSRHVKSANVSEVNSERTGVDKPKVQFSIRKLLVWTTIVGVGVRGMSWGNMLYEGMSESSKATVLISVGALSIAFVPTFLRYGPIPNRMWLVGLAQWISITLANLAIVIWILSQFVTHSGV